MTPRPCAGLQSGMTSSQTPSRPTAPLLPPALSPATLATLAQLGYRDMTPIQAAALPLALAGHDLIAQAKTGSGKTAAFALALLQRLDARSFATQALVLCPTRELAEQVTQEIRRLARGADNVKVLTLCGGTPMRPQVESRPTARISPSARRAASGPPAARHAAARRAQHAGARRSRPHARHGLLRRYRHGRERLPEGAPDAAVLGHLSGWHAKLSRQFLREPREVKLVEQHAGDTIRQRFYEVEEGERRPPWAACSTISVRPARWRSAILRAAATRRTAARAGLPGAGAAWRAGAARARPVLVQFANRSCSVLVATDVAARGLDIAQLEAVINVDVTPDPEVHVHRIGRTGRAARRLGLQPGQPGRDGPRRLHRAGAGHRGGLASAGRADAGQPRAAAAADGHAADPGGRKEKIRPGDVLAR